MRHHLDDETLTRLAAPGGEPYDRASAHLAHCGSCSRRLRDLRSVRYSLRTLPEPQTPGDLSHGIAARLADEPANPAARRPSVARFVHAVDARHLGIAATLAVIGGGMSIALAGNSSNSSSALPDLQAAASVSPDIPSGPPSASPTAPPTLGPHDSGNRVFAAADTLAAMPFAVSGEDFHHSTLADGAIAAFRRAATSTPATADSTRTAATPTGECLRALGRSLDHAPATAWQPAGVLVARFDGRPALVVALLSTDSSATEIAVAVDGLCVGSDPVVLDQAVMTAATGTAHR